MIPKILPDETLASFVQRVIHLSTTSREASQLNMLFSKGGDCPAAKTVAALLSWPGCFGFNRLLHNHTRYALHGIFNDGFDISYSGKRYGVQTSMGSPWQQKSAYCPSCVREDLENLGFAYWRRAHECDVTVCWKHNVVLLTSCHVCGGAFSADRRYRSHIEAKNRRSDKDGAHIPSCLVHGLEIIWEGCSQIALGDICSEINLDPTALRKARFYNDALNFGHLIPLESALRSLQQRFQDLQLQGAVFDSVCEDNFRAQRRIIHRLDLLRPGQERAFPYEGTAVIEAAMEVHETFIDFVDDVRSDATTLQPVESLWSTYISEGYESVQYIGENYASGVGVWSCPLPSIRSLDPASRDASRARRVRSFPCCNTVKMSDSEPTGVTKARVSFPKIPQIKDDIALKRRPASL